MVAFINSVRGIRMKIELAQIIRQCLYSGVMSGSILMCTNQSYAVETSDLAVRAVGTDMVAVGPIDAIDVNSSSFVVAGQRIAVSGETVMHEIGNANLLGFSAFKLFHIGDVLAVHGELDKPAVSISRLVESYVPGATSIYLRGRVTKVDSSIGVATVSSMRIDFTPAMAKSEFVGVNVGDIVEVFGMQPVIGGSLIATILRPDSARNNSITGTSLGANSITGTSHGGNSITGTSLGANSITGTSHGGNSITGTSLGGNSITGTSHGGNSITGTSLGANSITGTSI